MRILAHNTPAVLAGATLAVSLLTGAAAASQRAYCDQQARAYADQNTASNAVGGAIGGALLGAGAGALFGGHHAVGTGAAVGAGVGAVGGAANGSAQWNDAYWSRFNACMQGY